MTNKTTIPHLVIERYPHIAESVTIPDDIKGDEKAEHNFLFPLLMRNFSKEWIEICEEVDKLIEEGEASFDSADGTITLL